MSCASAAASSVTGGGVFKVGKYVTVLLRVIPESPASSSSPSVPPPKPLLIATPSDEGEFPLLVFLHGYLLYNSFYSQLILHIASHGFIVIAPQVSFFISSHRTRTLLSVFQLRCYAHTCIAQKLFHLMVN